MSNKQSSIEWLQYKLNNVKPTQFCSIETIKKWVEQAKEMHKREIMNSLLEHPNIDAEKYYNEHFGK